MLNLIAGVHKADGGRIILDGEDLTYKKRPKEQVHRQEFFKIR